MGLLNNNNHRRSKRANLRKQVMQSAQNNTGLTSNSLTGNASTIVTTPPSTGGGDGSGMMGAMQLAATATPMVMGFMQAKKQKELAIDLETERLAKDKEIQGLLNNRQNIRNPYANLAVATEAAEFEAQQVDQSLANTLDAMKAGGMGASGATALAREAAKSKQGISADIQKQEATNQKFFAQGEQIRQDMQEQRSMDDIDFARAQSDNLRQQEVNALGAEQASKQAGVGGMMQGIQGIMKDPEAVKSLFEGIKN